MHWLGLRHTAIAAANLFHPLKPVAQTRQSLIPVFRSLFFSSRVQMSNSTPATAASAAAAAGATVPQHIGCGCGPTPQQLIDHQAPPRSPVVPPSSHPKQKWQKKQPSAPDSASTVSTSSSTPSSDLDEHSNNNNNNKGKNNKQNPGKPSKSKPPVSSSSSAAAASSSPDTSIATGTVIDIKQIKLIDIGANLTAEMYQGEYHGSHRHPPDLTSVLDRAWQFGVERIIITAGSLSEARHALELAKTHPNLYCTVGVHPTRTKEFEGSPEHAQKYLDQLLAIAQEGKKLGKVVAIGECGLDYDRLHFSPKSVQLAHFEKHFYLTEATQLPMFLHDRNTGGDFYAIIKNNRHRFTQGVVHSFTGTTQELQELLKLNLYIGINGCSMKTPENMQTMCSVPESHLMLETDAPWCEVKNTHASSKYLQTKFSSKKPEQHNKQWFVKSRNEPAAMM